MITLSADATTITLPDDLYWSDEYEWQPVEQATERTITGALIVEASVRTGGRPITLAPPDDSSAWMSLATLDALKTWAATAGKVMQLSLRGVTRDVMFRHQDGGIATNPVVHYGTPDTNDFYLTTVRFMEI